MTDATLTEYLRDRGLLPDWAYYQMNGKTAQENYWEQRKQGDEVRIEVQVNI